MNEELAVLTAIEKVVSARIKEVRREANANLLNLYDQMGVEKVALKVGDQKVGDFYISFAKEGFDITDREAFMEFALDYGMATMKTVIRPEMMDTAVKALEQSFEPDVLEEVLDTEPVLDPNWDKGLTNVAGVVCYMDTNLQVPGVRVRPKAVKNTTVRDCKPEVVIPIAQSLPGGLNRFMLDGEVA